MRGIARSGLNCAHKPFDDQRVRQAMNFAMDRDAVNKLAYFGLLPVTQEAMEQAKDFVHRLRDALHALE